MRPLCNICKRELDTKDPTTRDCGGDCLLCMAEAGDPDAIAAILKALRNWPEPDYISAAQIICNAMIEIGRSPDKITIKEFISIAKLAVGAANGQD